MPTNLWILTEERPKKEVLIKIFERFAQEKWFACFIDSPRVIPVLENWVFSSTYQVTGLTSPKVINIYLKVVSWNSSFVDYLVYYCDLEPSPSDEPVLVIEETKTDDQESRNTWVYQRASKFVYVEYYYPNAPKIMLYSLQVKEKRKTSDTSKFWTRCFKTIWVEFLGKENNTELKPFESVNELIEYKNWMRRPPASNVPILLTKFDDRIEVSWRLIKSKRLWHDPNIWALSLIGCTLRRLGWDKSIVFTLHWLEQKMVKPNNKFIRICNRFGFTLKDIQIPISREEVDYWYYENKWEKLWTIFLHLLVEWFSEWMSIYENHAGCERWYFMTSEWKPLAVEKYKDKKKYKAWDKSQIVALPDLVLIDFKRSKILNIEWEMHVNVHKWIQQLEWFTTFEEYYLNKYYPDYSIIRTVVLYWWDDKEITVWKVSFLLNSHWDIIFSLDAPEIMRESLLNLKNYWN